MVSLELFIDIILPEVDSASSEDEHREYFLRGKATGA
jgi:hypothetical protein